jgi:hypothetical protein
MGCEMNESGQSMETKICSWINTRLAENSLLEVVEHFRQAGEDRYYLDRHIVDSLDDFPENLRDQKDLILFGAFELCNKWATEAKANSEFFFSEPFVIVDDSWVKGEHNAPPPHIQLCISKSPLELDDLFPITGSPSHCDIDGLNEIAKDKGFFCFRVSGDADSDGAWIFKPPKSTN